MSISELQGKAKELLALKKKIKELEGKRDILEQEMKRELTRRQTDELFAGAYTVRWVSFPVVRFDTTAFKTAHGDLYQQFTKETEQKRFTVA